MVKNGHFEGSTYMTQKCVSDLKIDIQRVFSNIVAFVEFEIDPTKIMKILGGGPSHHWPLFLYCEHSRKSQK